MTAMSRLCVAVLAAVAMLAAGAEARVCGGTSKTKLRDSVVGYTWTIRRGEPLLPYDAEAEANAKAEAKAEAALKANKDQVYKVPKWANVEQHFAVRDNTRTQYTSELSAAYLNQYSDTLTVDKHLLLKPHLHGGPDHGHEDKPDEVEEASTVNARLAEKATHVTVHPKNVWLVLEQETEGEKRHYVHVPTLHDHAGLRIHGTHRHVFVPVEKDGRVYLDVTVSSKGKHTIVYKAPGSDAAPTKISTSWNKHPGTGKTVPVVRARVVKVPGELYRGRFTPCVSPDVLCKKIQETWPTKDSTVHRNLMCAAFYESGFVPSTVQWMANRDTSCDAGLFQINSVHWSRFYNDPQSCHYRKAWNTPRCLEHRKKILSVEDNLKAARDVYKHGGLGNWYGHRDHCIPNDVWKLSVFSCPRNGQTPKDEDAAAWLVLPNSQFAPP